VSNQDTYTEENVTLFEAIYGPGLISLGSYVAVEEMFEGLSLQNKHLLDIGFGIGGMAYYLAEHKGASVTGLEIRPWMANYATAHTPSQIKDQVAFLVYAPDGPFPIPSRSADLVYSKGVLTNIANKRQLISEIVRVLKRGGQICFIDWLLPSRLGPSAERLRLGDMSYKETAESYEQLLTDCGFTSVKFDDLSSSYLQYAKDLRKHLSSVSPDFGEQLIAANEDLISSIEAGNQLSMRITASLGETHE
jgi:phosphoethanolamine N-methyltransferase